MLKSLQMEDKSSTRRHDDDDGKLGVIQTEPVVRFVRVLGWNSPGLFSPMDLELDVGYFVLSSFRIALIRLEQSNRKSV